MAPARETQAAPIKVLLVEDNQADADLIRECMGVREYPIRFSRVRDGEEALEFLRRQGPFGGAPRPDLILLDLNLPKRSGIEVLRDIKGDPDLSLIPTVVLTSSERQEDVLQSYGLHANGYVMKPVDFTQFDLVIRRLEDFWFGAAVIPRKSS